MASGARVLAFAGSAREGSFNKKALRLAADGVEQAGVACTRIDLRDYPMPLYDGDLEAREGLPASAAKLRELFGAHTGLLIASPEYNSSISPLLKNTLDWISRSPDGDGDLSPYRGKVAALLAASPGALGGLRGLVTLRSIFGNIGVTVLPSQVTVRSAAQAFGDDGALRDEALGERLRGLGRELAEFLLRLQPDSTRQR